MGSRRREAGLPACYALVQPGLEEIAAEEIVETLGGEIKRTGPGLVVFRLEEIERSVLKLTTTEDMFVMAWGTDQLSYRAEDLERIRKWTKHDADWQRLLQIHHAIRPKPKGKPTYRLVTQMRGEHGYRRADAQKMLARGLAGKLPASWRAAEENAAVEIWLTIQGATAVCGLRLSDQTMRHRWYKVEHVPASLRPTVAAALVRLADLQSGQLLVDPLCGAGTILGEALLASRRDNLGLRVLGGDLERRHVRAALANIRRFEPVGVVCWDARRLPLPDQAVDRVVSNPPFGVQLGDAEAIGPLYRGLVREADRVLRPGGRAVFLVAEARPLREGAQKVGWQQLRQVALRVLGQRAVILVYRKPG